jgi:hypothetical protein
MKRIFITAVAASALVCAVPAAALARHHHARHSHKRHAHKARVLRFGSVRTASATPSSPAPQATSGETAGTVTSFENGVLTITLNDKSTVTGKVTSETEVLCQTATASGGDDDEQEGNDEGSSSNGEHSSSAIGPAVRQHGDWLQAPGQHEGLGQGNNQTQENCSTAALVKDAVVLGAELKLGPAGAVWEKVILKH